MQKTLVLLLAVVASVYSKLPKDECTIIKSPLPIPPVGVVCANPDRARLIATDYFDWYYTHTDFRGYKVYVGESKGVQLFSAFIGLGSASAAFMMEELVAHDVQVVIRLGTNDYNVTEADVKKVYVVQECHNMIGLKRDYGYPEDELDVGIPADAGLVQAMIEAAPRFPEIQVIKSIGYNVDAFYSFFDPTNVAYDPERVRNIIAQYEKKRANCRDMETCAVLLIGQIHKIRTASALQAVVKSGPKHEGTATTGILLVLDVLRRQAMELKKQQFKELMNK
jgi:uridine phosphorylase